MDMIEKTTATEYKFKGRIINTRVDDVLLPDGSQSTREIVEHNGGVGILPYDGCGNVYLIKQYRHPYGEVIFEIPAGKIEQGEQPMVCGQRELKEETGMTAAFWKDMGIIYPTPGYCTEKIYLFIATELTQGETQFDQGEFIELFKLPLSQAIELVMSGQIRDAKTQIALLKLKEDLHK